MKGIFLFAAMLFFHVLDDFHLQGLLINMKQKAWWQEQTTDQMYKNDYIVALLIHAFSWTFMIHIPAWMYSLHFHTGFSSGWVYVIVFLAMLLIHAFVDNLKANKHKINLIQDQLSHVVQIAYVAILYSLPQKGA